MCEERFIGWDDYIQRFKEEGRDEEQKRVISIIDKRIDDGKRIGIPDFAIHLWISLKEDIRK